MKFVDTVGLWIKPIPTKRIENVHGWAELRVEYENENDLTTGYFDILIGKKEKEKGKGNIHVIQALNGKPVKVESRGILQSITQKVESKTNGKVSEESLVQKLTPPQLPVDIEITFEGSTKEVVVKDFRFNNSVIFE